MTHICDICYKYKCNSYDRLMTHKFLKHNDVMIPKINNMKYTCITCKSVFHSEFELMIHEFMKHNQL